MTRRIVLLGMVLGLSLGMIGQQAHAQELPTGAARVVQKVQLMALTGKNEIAYKVVSSWRTTPARSPIPEHRHRTRQTATVRLVRIGAGKGGPDAGAKAPRHPLGWIPQ